jgi:hypothetical protein
MKIYFKKALFPFFMILMIMKGPIPLVAQSKVNYRNLAQSDTAVGYASFYSNKFIGKKLSLIHI